jgi:hypothetical protein
MFLPNAMKRRRRLGSRAASTQGTQAGVDVDTGSAGCGWPVVEGGQGEP